MMVLVTEWLWGCTCRNDMQAVDENQTPWPWRWEPQCAELPEDAPYEEVIKCRKIPERQSRGESRTAARITVNHYLTKSEEDFKMKVERGSGGGVARKWTEFYDLQRYVLSRIEVSPLIRVSA